MTAGEVEIALAIMSALGFIFGSLLFVQMWPRLVFGLLEFAERAGDLNSIKKEKSAGQRLIEDIRAAVQYEEEVLRHVVTQIEVSPDLFHLLTQQALVGVSDVEARKLAADGVAYLYGVARVSPTLIIMKEDVAGWRILDSRLIWATDQAAGLPITLALNKFMFGMIGAVEEALKSADVEIIEPDD